jgi:hypothetical protein
MSTWIEMRCEDRGTTASRKRGCLSDVNDGPMGMAGDTQDSVLQTLRSLHAKATEQGWKRMQQGWVCPRCIPLAGRPAASNGNDKGEP